MHKLRTMYAKQKDLGLADRMVFWSHLLFIVINILNLLSVFFYSDGVAAYFVASVVFTISSLTGLYLFDKGDTKNSKRLLIAGAYLIHVFIVFSEQYLSSNIVLAIAHLVLLALILPLVSRRTFAIAALFNWAIILIATYMRTQAYFDEAVFNYTLLDITIVAILLAYSWENERLLNNEIKSRLEMANLVYLFQLLARTAAHDMRPDLQNLVTLLNARKLPNLVEKVQRVQGSVSKFLEDTRSITTTITPNIKTVELDAVFRKAVTTFTGEAQAKKVKVEWQVSLTISTDPDLLQNVLTNLVGNSLRFTPAGGGINIVADQQNQFVVIRVSDTGAGMPKSKVDEIRRSGRTATTTADQGNFGIGIASVFQNVGLLGGTVDVESQLGQGTTFTIQLPISQ